MAAQFPADHLRQHPERLIAHVMTVQVVVQLQVVHVHQRHTAAEYLRAHVALVVVAAESAGQSILLLLLGVPAGDHQRVVVHPVDADIVLPVPLPSLPEAQAEAVAVLTAVKISPQAVAVEEPHPYLPLRRILTAVPEDVPHLVHAVPLVIDPLYQTGLAHPQPAAAPVVFAHRVAEGQQRRDKTFLLYHHDIPHACHAVAGILSVYYTEIRRALQQPQEKARPKGRALGHISTFS